MTGEESNQIVEFMRTIQVIFVLGLIVVSALSPIIVSCINVYQ